GVEVDGVAEGPVVDQRDLEDVTHLAAQGRTGHRAVERPALLPHPRRDLERDLLRREGHPVDGGVRGRRERRVDGLYDGGRVLGQQWGSGGGVLRSALVLAV